MEQRMRGPLLTEGSPVGAQFSAVSLPVVSTMYALHADPLLMFIMRAI
jgi:hypothetical protein